ncbi:lipoprotein-anchoring transpeptidase ErfK/SrfK [Angulomicrobium tetraedrale]|uniref:Lipoprotein-anchoring transpeptidase ErfK/SrfK n=1 Tax=Ancylobacter tetraedralis TaxID=217068 RepID=A0A839ZFY8_9HYPH|nr:L,D-transpeptidase [Ancylobacter tetraedralis]MBB3773495.1 lipoprotein-anchoring transpeptidase ErfK/SrfK [Ancylobacter tetraedralis]
MPPTLWILAASLLALWVLLSPAQAQGSIYDSGSSYRVFSGQAFSGEGAGSAQRYNPPARSGWRPGAGNVYPPGEVHAPPPADELGADVDAPMPLAGSAYAVGGGVYGTLPPGSPPPRGTPVTRGAGSANTYGASRTGVAAVEAAAYGSADYYREDGPPLPVAREASGGKGVDPKFDRRVVRYAGRDRAGTIIVDTGARFLYLVQGDGTAIRYGIGVGREGFAWSGTQRITSKREWPDWRPPAEMIARRPDLPEVMAGGPDNPLGARALYLGNTLYRIHGSNEPESIGRAVSSGCIRMRNEDVIDLYERVPVGAVVRVI